MPNSFLTNFCSLLFVFIRPYVNDALFFTNPVVPILEKFLRKRHLINLKFDAYFLMYASLNLVTIFKIM